MKSAKNARSEQSKRAALVPLRSPLGSIPIQGIRVRVHNIANWKNNIF